MRLSPVLVEHIAAQVVNGLIQEKLIEVEDESAARGAVAAAFAEDLSVEDRLNDEVREILRTHSDELARRGIQYHEMFKMVKAELVRKRKLIL